MMKRNMIATNGNLSKVFAVMIALAVLLTFSVPSETFAVSKSKNNYAKSIKTSVGRLSPKFTKKKTSYKISLKASQTKTKLTFKKSHNTAKVRVKVGAAKWGKYSSKASVATTVKVANGKSVVVRYGVKAQSGETKTYKITVTRAPSVIAINALANQIKAAIDGKQANYAVNSWNALQTALANAGDGALTVGTMTQVQIDALYAALDAAYKALADISKLKAELALPDVDPANDEINQPLYTTSTWYRFDNIRIMAQITVDNPDTTRVQADSALFNLKFAAKARALRGNPESINTLANEILREIAFDDLVENDYAKDSWTLLRRALTAAGSGDLDTSNLTQQQVDNLKNKLEIARKTDGNGTLVDIRVLKSAIDEAKSRNRTLFTAASWTTFETVINAVNGVLTKPGASRAEVEKAVADLAAATTALKTGYIADLALVTVSASISGISVFKDAIEDRSVTLQSSIAGRVITLTGAAEGNKASSATISWGTSDAAGNLTASGGTGGTQYTVTIPANATGHITVTFTASNNGISKARSVSIYVTNISEFTVDYQAYDEYYYMVKDVKFADADKDNRGPSFDHGSDVTMATTSRAFRARAFNKSGGEITGTNFTWSIVNQGGTGAQLISPTGKTNSVMIPVGYAGTITIKVASSDCPSYDVVFDIVVGVRPTIAAEARALTTTSVFDTADWLEVATQRVGGIDYSLIVRQAVLPAVPGYGVSHAFGEDNNYIGSDVQKHINAWYADLPANSLLVTHAVNHNALERLGTTCTTVWDGYSTPKGGTPSARKDVAFALSSSEVISFMSRFIIAQDANKENETNMGEGSQQYKNWDHLADGKTQPYTWLRSPGGIPATGGFVSTASTLLHDHVRYGYINDNTYFAVRPALWVRSEIFN
ncbi:MAG: cadherin-like beta sandwich domain-containing protein [Clostridiales Family XIII bacterium]|jgi:hypothetical protein|nr:cadherin-like beta sandwich domain-containing protein [Clostridiales Family XIII bacterium]